jgi:secreted trypsin-like serine protease
VRLHDSSTTPDDSDIFTVSTIEIHPEYDEDNIRNDVALIKLTESITFSDEVSAVCLPTANSHASLYGKTVVVSGWGLTQAGVIATNLQQATLKVVTDSNLCATIPNYISDEQYCVIEDDASPDTNVCSGDSGGPLVYFDGSKWTLYGITSYVLTVNDACDSTQPSYFTSVPYYLNFIYPESLESSANCLNIISAYLFISLITIYLLISF